jgi:hypothetical protein
MAALRNPSRRNGCVGRGNGRMETEKAIGLDRLRI